VIVTAGPVLKVPGDDLRLPLSGASAIPRAANHRVNSHGDPGNMRAVLDDAERKQILAALEQTNWTVAGPDGAAARLGMKRSTLQSRMQKLGIRISRTGA
jgi:formate hydrogenlyase transcriptional activator